MKSATAAAGPQMLFLAAKLDRGGVADHVRRLVPALETRGFRARAVGRREAGEALASAPGSVVALHFVCYGWAPRGLIRGREIKELRAATAGHRLAIYFHELWIGEARGESLKHRFVGLLQRRGIRRLLESLRPSHVLTSNAVYGAMLADLGHPAEILPLPGNLPPADAAARAAAREWLASRRANGAEVRAALFGAIHPEWDGGAALASWCADAARRGRAARLLALGRLGPAAANRLAALRAAAPGVILDVTGELPAELVAGLLAECEVAFATSPWALIGKSGSAAAFLEAGLPIVVTRDEWRRRRGVTPLPAEQEGLALWPRGGAGFDWPAFLRLRPVAGDRLAEAARRWAEIARDGAFGGGTPA